MNKKGILLGIILFLLSLVFFYLSWSSNEPAKCVASALDTFYGLIMLCIGVLLMMFAFVCFRISFNEKEEKKEDAKSKHKLPNKK